MKRKRATPRRTSPAAGRAFLSVAASAVMEEGRLSHSGGLFRYASGRSPEVDPMAESPLFEPSSGERIDELRQAVEAGDGIFVVRGGGTCRGWNNIRYKVGLSAKNTPAR